MPTEMKPCPDAADLYHWVQQLQSFYHDVLTPIIDVTTKVKKAGHPSYTLPDLVDLGWCFRMFASFADDLRKEALARQDLIGKLIALEATKRVLADPVNEELNVRGVYATGLPDVKQSPKLPKPGTPEFRTLCETLGVGGDSKEEGLVRFHFPTMVKWISERMEAGEDTPKGLLGTYPVYRTTFRTRRRKNDE